MELLVLTPLIPIWIVAYWAAKFPAQMIGRLVVSCSPNVLSDIGLSIVLSFFLWCLAMIIVFVTQAIAVSYPYTMKELAVGAAFVLVPPVLVALFNGTLYARSNRRSSD
jgi:hypothetical protein